MKMGPTNLNQGSYYLSYLLPWAQLRELAGRPETPRQALAPLREAMRHQEQAPGIFDHTEQVAAIRELLSFDEVTAELERVPAGPVQAALSECKTGIELARAGFNAELQTETGFDVDVELGSFSRLGPGAVL